MDLRRVIMAIVIVPLVGCGASSITPIETHRADPSAVGAAEPITLPGPNALLPAGAVEAVSWIEMSNLPNDFDPTAGYASTSDLADAFGEAIHAGWTGSPDRPDLSLETFDASSERAVLIISETGFGDDSVAGSQYALVVSRGSDGWVLDNTWTRALCRRAVFEDLCV